MCQAAMAWQKTGQDDLRAMIKLFPALLLLAAAPAGAQPIRAIYEVYAAGMTVLQVEAEIETTATGYRMTTAVRPRGVVATFFPGQQATRVQGQWAGLRALPSSYHSEGVWRGTARRTTLGWEGATLRLVDLLPADSAEHEPVSDDQKAGTTDALSALALASRAVQATGRCETEAAIFDGRRRSTYRLQTVGTEAVRPWRDAWHGQALRCGFEGRLVAGFRLDQPRERERAATPQTGTVWIASPYPGAPALPVRLETQNRWVGTATAVLLRVEPAPPIASPVSARPQ